MQITTIGLDIAKNVFQVHGIDATEKVVVRKQLRRGQVLAFFKALAPCLIGMEACATAPERFAEMPDFSLAPRAPSIFQTCQHVGCMSACGVSADNICSR